MNIASSRPLPGKWVADSQDAQARAELLLSTAQRLRRLAESFEDEASSLCKAPWDGPHSGEGDTDLIWRQLRAIAVNIYQQRRCRDQLFGANLFGEPAWDMLLDIFVHSIDGRAVRTKDMTLASAVPATTALRWIGQLEFAGLIERRDCTQDKRVHLLTLTAKGMDFMIRCLTTVTGDRDARSHPLEPGTEPADAA